MKKIILTTLIATAVAVGSFAQGTFRLDNTANTGVYGGFGGVAFSPGTGTGNPVYSANVVSNGLVFTTDAANSWAAFGGPAGSQMLGADVNIQVLGGATAGTLSNLFTLSVGTSGTGDNVNWGQIQDPAGTVHTIPGVTAGSIGVLDLLIWEGTGTTYGAAGVYSGTTGTFNVATGGGTTLPGVLNNMPDVLLTVPEPSILALSGIGAAALMLVRRKR